MCVCVYIYIYIYIYCFNTYTSTIHTFVYPTYFQSYLPLHAPYETCIHTHNVYIHTKGFKMSNIYCGEGSHAEIMDSVLRNSRYGVELTGQAYVTLERCELRDNECAAFVAWPSKFVMLMDV